MTDLGDLARVLRRCPELADPVRLCAALGLDDGAKRQATGLIVRCPSHGDRTPSCSVTEGPDGTVRVRCFSCEFTADALGLIEQTLGCRSFAETIDQACDLVGRPRPGEPEATAWVSPCQPNRAPRPAPQYPWSSDLERFWGNLGPVAGHALSADMLRNRAIDPGAVDRYGLARTITGRTPLPDFARYRGSADTARSWGETGHLLVLPVYDHDGQMRSVRAWRVLSGDLEDVPRRLPPAGCRASGLVLANTEAQMLLRGELGPERVVFAEGEPDFLVWATRFEGPVIGILSGSWSPEFAAKIPTGSTLVLRTDRDRAGDAYAGAIAKSCSGRCHIRRAA